MEFLAENNVCGQTLLRLVARGNSIIAELNRLAKATPKIFRLESKNDIQKYGEVLMDFSYFQAPDLISNKIENNQKLCRLDNEIRERHLTVVCRIYAVFESIHRYVTHLINFVKELKDGTYLHTSMENVFADYDGKQLLCEGLYLYGVMLLLVDKMYPGTARERLIVCHCRHAGVADTRSTDTNVDDVCRLLRSTGLRPGQKRPLGYPEDYFKRIEVPKDYLERVLGHLRTDDIYNQVSVFPSPEHRAAAFSTQAAMLYVCLYFAPQILHSQQSRMREIVDRFFPDNWVLSYYMGNTTNLMEAWEPYKAAKQALSNTSESGNVVQIASSIKNKLASLTTQAIQLESEGVLTKAKVLGHSATLFKLLRECNVTLRWLVLHCAPLESAGGGTIKRCKTIRDQIISEIKYSPNAVFDLLLHTSGLEFKVTQIYKKILEEKNKQWNELIKVATSRLEELSEAFNNEGSARPLARVKPNSRLQKWFSSIAEQIQELSVDSEPGVCAHKLVLIAQALTEVKEYHDLNSCGGAVQAVEEVSDALQSLLHLTTAEHTDMAILATLADLSYAWVLIDQYTPIMQRRIRQEPGEVAQLRSVFLKLSSGLELPLMRITQAGSQDVMSVSAFYSNKLVTYIRKVLQIIPDTIFELIGNIADLQTHHFNDLPMRLDKDKLKEFAQLPQRYKIAELCHSVGVLAEGVAEMGDTLVGVQELHPRQLLEDGMRRELVHRVASLIHTNIIFTNKKGSVNSELVEKLSGLAKLLKGFRSSFEYIQDYINLYALKIWHEELTRIIGVNVDQECEVLLPGSTHSNWDDIHAVVPVPVFPQADATGLNFMGRLTAEIIRLTHPKQSVYLWLKAAWFDTRLRALQADPGVLFAQVEDAMTIAGVAGVDRLLACRTICAVKELYQSVDTSIDASTRDILQGVVANTSPNTTIVKDPQRQYSTWVNRLYRIVSPILLDTLQTIGQLQLLRMHASHRLHAALSFHATYLQDALNALNISILKDASLHNINPSCNSHPDPSSDNPLTSELTSLLEWVGCAPPLERIYSIPSDGVVKVLPHVLLMVVISVLPKLQYSNKFGTLMSIKSSEGLDGSALVVGVVTVLRQCPQATTTLWLSLMAQYISSVTHALSGVSPPSAAEVPAELDVATHLLQTSSQLLRLAPHQLKALMLVPLSASSQFS